MAFLFVVHVPYVLSDSKQLGVSNGVRISDESVVSNGERNGELEAVGEENEDDNTSADITGKYHLGLAARKPVFEVFDKARLKPACSATETS